MTNKKTNSGSKTANSTTAAPRRLPRNRRGCVPYREGGRKSLIALNLASRQTSLFAIPPIETLGHKSGESNRRRGYRFGFRSRYGLASAGSQRLPGPFRFFGRGGTLAFELRGHHVDVAGELLPEVFFSKPNGGNW